MHPSFFEISTSGPMPWAVTDMSGVYRLITPAFGKTRICVQLVGLGYPDTIGAVFASGTETWPEINLTPGSRFNDIDIHLNSPDGIVDAIVQDKQTGKSIDYARVILRRKNEPEVMYASNVSKGGTFVFALPDRPITITVTASGYMPWQYLDPIAGNPFIQLRTGEHKTVIVALDPSTEQHSNP